MPDPPRTPGVYVREVSGGPPPIAAVETSIATFVGRFARGPLDHPVLVTGILGFERVFGAPGRDHPAPWEVHQFFHNGGARAWIVRVARGATVAAATLTSGGQPVLVAGASAGPELAARLGAELLDEDIVAAAGEVAERVR